MSKFYIDSETCGLHSQMVLLQYAIDDGPIHLVDVWQQPIRNTLNLIEKFCEETVVGFNLAFDWFHLVKFYTVMRLADPDWIPIEHIYEIAMLEPEGQQGPAVKPANALDLMLHSRKGPYQSLMAREDVRVKKVPTALAYALADELESRIELDGIYFARSADKDAPRWQVLPRKDKDGEIDTDFMDVVLKFNPAGGLKFLAEHALGYKPKYHYKHVEPDEKKRPIEYGFAPTALAVSTPDQKWEAYGNKDGKYGLIGYAWPARIQYFVDHWATRADAREYASDDIRYTRLLDEHFGFPTPGDNDSILACMVPVVRWRGFQINKDGIAELRSKARAVVDSSPVNINTPSEVRRYVCEPMDETEAIRGKLSDSTEKKNIESIAKWNVTIGEECEKCFGTESSCTRCGGTGRVLIGTPATPEYGNHPAAIRAYSVLEAKTAAKEVELYDKLSRAGKFHASFNVVGTLSSRMSGGDGLNAQGIKKTKEVRRMFPLAWEGYVLCGGDFDSFEVTLADAVYHDPALRQALTTRVPCHKCDAVGYVSPCPQCKGKGKRAGKPCDFCSGKGRLLVTDGDPNLILCGECDGSKLTTKKIHALFAMSLFPGTSYEDVIASEGTSFDMYSKGKSGVFAMIYGGGWETLVKNLRISEDVAKAAFEDFTRRFPGVYKARERTFDAFCSMRQPGGIGTQVVWAAPAEFIESFLGFRRYFTLENKICEALFDLAGKPPKAWKNVKLKVVRRDRVQTVGGAVASALYAAAFGMQAANMRAAANHEIQSPGGEITKAVQRKIWDLQPVGIHPLYVAPMNVHDELMTVTHPDYVTRVTETVRATVDFYREKVPLIGMSWFEAMANWAEKKDGSEKIKMRPAELM